jgi:nicotinamide phosphoribosyltransferase
MAHLFNFQGSDTFEGVCTANDYYDCEMSAFSIPAAEHSTITSWGRENEAEAYRNMLRQFAKPGAIIAVVSDSYDIYNACEHIWGDVLRQEVIDSGAVVVIRPDSGDPATVVLKCLTLLDQKFGSKLNSKGYLVLNNVRVIQGDGVNRYSIKAILDVITEAGFSATNVGFGMGGALLQLHGRDDWEFAMKCSYIKAGGVDIDVYKDPVTDKKKSSTKFRGRLDLECFEGRFSTVRLEPNQLSAPYSVMQSRIINGIVKKKYSLAEARKFAAII